MAIARDAVAASIKVQSSGFTLTQAHDAGSGSNRFLVVALQTPTPDDVTGVTFNGVAMTRMEIDAGGGCQLWGLHAPATGTHDVVVTNSGFTYKAVVIKCYTGVQQSVTPDAISGSTDTGGGVNHLQMSTTTVADNSWVFYASICAATGSNPSAGTGSSLVGQVTADPSFGSFTLYDSNSPVTPAGSYAMDAVLGSNTSWRGVQVSLAPAGAGGGITLPELESGPSRGLMRGMPGRIHG